ncbi:hypothetical protein C0J52_18731 [Blattella germanica]|nr:hypothetical protein C0J52_18731 [Blattella germanica]
MDFKMLEWKFVIVLVVIMTLGSALICDDDECVGRNCSDPKELALEHQPPCKENQRYNSYGTYCGCCPACVDILGMLKFITVAVILGCLTSVSSYICSENECDGVNCTDPNELSIDHQPPCKENQRYNSYGTFCGCCPACVNDLDLGSSCYVYPLTAASPPPLFACKEGLLCWERKCSLPTTSFQKWLVDNYN